MPITVQCAKCGKRLKAPDSVAGKRVKCPGCGGAVAVPAAAPAPGSNLLDDLGENDLLGGGLGDLDPLSQAVGNSLPAAGASLPATRAPSGGPSSGSAKSRGASSGGADPLGPAPTPQAAAPKKAPPNMLLIGGAVGAAVFVVLLIIVAIFTFSGSSTPEVAQTGGAPAAPTVATVPAATAPPAAPVAPQVPAGGNDDAALAQSASLFDVPAAAPPSPTSGAAPPAQVAGGAPPATQPGSPVALASASQPVPPVPATAPAPVAIGPPAVNVPPAVNPPAVAKAPPPIVNAPPPVQNLPNGPLDPQQKAKNEQAARDQLKSWRKSQLALLSGAPETLVEQMRWSPAANRPTRGLRFGINLPIPQMAKAGRPQPPVAADSEQAIVQAIGPAGQKLLAGLNERIGRGDFGGKADYGSDGPSRVSVLAGEDRGETLVAARANDVDVLILLKIEFQPAHHRKTAKPQQPATPGQMAATLTARIVDVAAGTPGWQSEPLRNRNQSLLEQDAAEWANDNLSQIDEFKLAPLPALDEKQTEKRMDELEKKKIANPMSALLEVRYYQIKGLIPIDRASAFYAQVLGEPGKLLASDDAGERKQALEKLAKQ